MTAAEKGDMKIVDILIKAGADICLEDEVRYKLPSVHCSFTSCCNIAGTERD